MRLWLKNLRLAKNLSQQDMAERLNISQANYSKIETGDRQDDLNLSTMVALAKIFKISLNKISMYEAERKEA